MSILVGSTAPPTEQVTPQKGRTASRVTKSPKTPKTKTKSPKTKTKTPRTPPTKSNVNNTPSSRNLQEFFPRVNDSRIPPIDGVRFETFPVKNLTQFCEETGLHQEFTPETLREVVDYDFVDVLAILDHESLPVIIDMTGDKEWLADQEYHMKQVQPDNNQVWMTLATIPWGIRILCQSLVDAARKQNEIVSLLSARNHVCVANVLPTQLCAASRPVTTHALLKVLLDLEVSHVRLSTMGIKAEIGRWKPEWDDLLARSKQPWHRNAFDISITHKVDYLCGMTVPGDGIDHDAAGAEFRQYGVRNFPLFAALNWDPTSATDRFGGSVTTSLYMDEKGPTRVVMFKSYNRVWHLLNNATKKEWKTPTVFKGAKERLDDVRKIYNLYKSRPEDVGGIRLEARIEATTLQKALIHFGEQSCYSPFFIFHSTGVDFGEETVINLLPVDTYLDCLDQVITHVEQCKDWTPRTDSRPLTVDEKMLVNDLTNCIGFALKPTHATKEGDLSPCWAGRPLAQRVISSPLVESSKFKKGDWSTFEDDFLLRIVTQNPKGKQTDWAGVMRMWESKEGCKKGLEKKQLQSRHRILLSNTARQQQVTSPVRTFSPRKSPAKKVVKSHKRTALEQLSPSRRRRQSPASPCELSVEMETEESLFDAAQALFAASSYSNIVDTDEGFFNAAQELFAASNYSTIVENDDEEESLMPRKTVHPFASLSNVALTPAAIPVVVPESNDYFLSVVRNYLLTNDCTQRILKAIAKDPEADTRVGDHVTTDFRREILNSTFRFTQRDYGVKLLPSMSGDARRIYKTEVESNRCLFIHLGLAIGVNPYTLMIALRALAESLIEDYPDHVLCVADLESGEVSGLRAYTVLGAYPSFDDLRVLYLEEFELFNIYLQHESEKGTAFYCLQGRDPAAATNVLLRCVNNHFTLLDPLIWRDDETKSKLIDNYMAHQEKVMFIPRAPMHRVGQRASIRDMMGVVQRVNGIADYVQPINDPLLLNSVTAKKEKKKKNVLVDLMGDYDSE